MTKKQRILNAIHGMPADRVPTSWYTHFPDQRDNTVADQVAWAKAADMDMLCVETDGYMQFDCGNTDLSSPAALLALRPHRASDPYIAGQVDRARRIAEGLRDDAAGADRLILSADCSVQGDTPVEHLRWVKEACETYAARG